MNLKKTTTGIILGTTAIVGATFGIDSKINPYENFSDRVEMITTSDLPNSGEQKVEIMKDKPQVRFKKWNGEVNLGLTYNDVKATGNRPLLSNKMEFKDVKQEVAVYPLNATSTEIEVILLEKPVSNIIKFTLDNYQNLDFFYQPALTQKEIDEGANRPENVVGSYAVFAKEKANHIVGQTNYGTGKVGHIFRPKIIDSAGTSVWGDLHIENGILSVTIPQNFLDTGIYPVIVDPTFGYTSEAATQHLGLTSSGILMFTEATGAAGTGTSISAWLATDATGSGTKATYNIYDASLNQVTNGKTAESAGLTTTKSLITLNFSSAPTFTAQTYHLSIWGSAAGGPGGNLGVYYDTSAGKGYWRDTDNTYNTFPNPAAKDTAYTDRIYSIYATYQQASTPTTDIQSDLIIFE